MDLNTLNNTHLYPVQLQNELPAKNYDSLSAHMTPKNWGLVFGTLFIINSSEVK